MLRNSYKTDIEVRPVSRAMSLNSCHAEINVSLICLNMPPVYNLSAGCWFCCCSTSWWFRELTKLQRQCNEYCMKSSHQWILISWPIFFFFLGWRFGRDHWFMMLQAFVSRSLLPLSLYSLPSSIISMTAINNGCHWLCKMPAPSHISELSLFRKVMLTNDWEHKGIWTGY